MKHRFAQYGCGLSAPEDWLNFDASPTLRIQRTPVLNVLLRPKPVFPANVRYGDIIKGLPVKDDELDGVFCSHVLEHLSLEDFRRALRNTYKILKPGGVFRLVLPDLEFYARKYLEDLSGGDALAAMTFIRQSMLGIERRPRGLGGMFRSFLGNSHHLWLWDYPSLSTELAAAGFRNIRRCEYHDGPEAFHAVEEYGRFVDCLAVECYK
ncbi:MAG TPA: methyltransferase domain-containing protein [Puia sp.]|nr:methyltransferase domain-containing protein [Puia sp.]